MMSGRNLDRNAGWLLSKMGKRGLTSSTTRFGEQQFPKESVDFLPHKNELPCINQLTDCLYCILVVWFCHLIGYIFRINEPAIAVDHKDCALEQAPFLD